MWLFCVFLVLGVMAVYGPSLRVRARSVLAAQCFECRLFLILDSLSIATPCTVSFHSLSVVC